MRYCQFYSALTANTTSRVVGKWFPTSCFMTQIPPEFGKLLPDVVDIINKNIDVLCVPTQSVVIFGMQLAPLCIKSSAARVAGRFLRAGEYDKHFCCSLSYMVVTSDKVKNLKTWSDAQNVVIDFTTGEVMTEEGYLERVSGKMARQDRHSWIPRYVPPAGASRGMTDTTNCEMTDVTSGGTTNLLGTLNKKELNQIWNKIKEKRESVFNFIRGRASAANNINLPTIWPAPCPQL